MRVNLATGEREAKLLDPSERAADEARNQRLSIVREAELAEEDEGMEGESDAVHSSEVDMSELKRIMQKMMEEGIGEPQSTSQKVHYLTFKFVIKGEHRN